MGMNGPIGSQPAISWASHIYSLYALKINTLNGVFRNMICPEI